MILVRVEKGFMMTMVARSRYFLIQDDSRNLDFVMIFGLIFICRAYYSILAMKSFIAEATDFAALWLNWICLMVFASFW